MNNNYSPSVSNVDKIIDSREILERISLLKDELDELAEELEEAEQVSDNEDTIDSIQGEIDEYEEELESLQDVVDQGEQLDNWEFGVTLIHKNYWEDYVREEQLSDILPFDLPWYVADNIDWAGVADAISMDYLEIDFNGETYYAR